MFEVLKTSQYAYNNELRKKVLFQCLFLQVLPDGAAFAARHLFPDDHPVDNNLTLNQLVKK